MAAMDDCGPRPPEALALLEHFYPEDTPLRRMLLKHSFQVRDKALEILRGSGLGLDCGIVAAAALLHDIGIGRCHAPGIFCCGDQPYLAHGVIGARMLREYGQLHGIDLEACARVCERHTGSGLTAQEVQAQQLPIPVQDYLPETPLERLVCLADKFFSKSGDMAEKPLERVRAEMARFGAAPLARLDELCVDFGLAAAHSDHG